MWLLERVVLPKHFRKVWEPCPPTPGSVLTNLLLSGNYTQMTFLQTIIAKGVEDPYVFKKQPTCSLQGSLPCPHQPYKPKTFRSHSYSGKKLDSGQYGQRKRVSGCLWHVLQRINSMGEYLLHTEMPMNLNGSGLHLTSSIWTIFITTENTVRTKDNSG